MSCNQNSQNDFQIMHWNAQGITSPSAMLELEHVLNEKHIDIVLINETFLKPHHKFKLKNYNIHRQDRLTHGGGVLIGVKKNIPHKRLPKFPTTTIENVSILISVNNGPIRITSAYCPQYSSHFTDDLDKITTTRNDFFIFGDFNAKHTSWNCHHNNRAGSKLYNHQITSHYYVHYPGCFTRYGQQVAPTLPSVVDLLLTNSSLLISPIETHKDILNSDHVPMTCTIYGSIIVKSMLVPQYNKANWIAIQKWVDDEIRNLNLHTVDITQTNVEDVLAKITQTIQGSSNLVPVTEIEPWQKKLSQISIYLIGQRRKYRRRLQRSIDILERRTLTSILKQLNLLIKYHVLNDRNNSWSKFIHRLPIGKKKFWLLSKAIKGKRAPVGTLHVDGADIYDSEIKANTIAQTFENFHGTTHSIISPNERKVIKFCEWLDNTCLQENIDDVLTSVDEVRFYVNQLKNSKAPGIDGIKPIVLKNMPNSIFIIISKVFNWCLTTGYFPEIFKNAKVIPILKQGKDPKSPTSYRPISMLNCLGKVFEKIILSRLSEFTESNSILREEQFGFRKEFSTTHQIKRIVNLIRLNKSQRKSTGIIFLDVEKAFDTIWHKGLVYKLKNFGYPMYILKIVKSFLENRKFVVEIDATHSSPRNILAGVPQGSVLSPILYSIYTSDYKLPRNSTLALYADDTALVSCGKVSNAIIKNMKKNFLHTEKYLKNWKIQINQGKTQAIIFPFNKSPKRIPSIPLNIQGHQIPIQTSVKYLGIILDKRLSFKEHVLHACDRAIKCGRALYPLLNRKSKLNTKNKLLLYKMCIRPIMTYGCQIWAEICAKTYLKKLQIIQNKNLKIIHNLPRLYPTSLLHRRFKENMFNTITANLSRRFEDRNRSSQHNVIRNLNQ